MRQIKIDFAFAKLLEGNVASTGAMYFIHRQPELLSRIRNDIRFLGHR